MKEIISKNLDKRLHKEAGLWDAVKGIGSGLKGMYDKGKEGLGNMYDKGSDFYNKARLGWELGKTEFDPAWKQQLEAIKHKHLYPMTPEGKPVYIDERTGKPINPYYQPGLSPSIRHNRGMGMLRGKTINPLYRKDPIMQGKIQEAISQAYNLRDDRLLRQLEQQKVIINEKDLLQPGAEQQAVQTAPAKSTPAPINT